MPVHLRHDVYIHAEQPATDDILAAIERLRRELMAKLEDFQAVLSAIDTETTRIGDYIQALVGQLNREDLTDEQEATVLTSLSAAADRLRGIAQTPENPVPEDVTLPPIE